jgi:hypothetical protein
MRRFRFGDMSDFSAPHERVVLAKLYRHGLPQFEKLAPSKFDRANLVRRDNECERRDGARSMGCEARECSHLAASAYSLTKETARAVCDVIQINRSRRNAPAS